MSTFTRMMHRLYPYLAVLFVVFLSGCAGTIVRSEVTAFHEWGADAGDKSYSFSRDEKQANDLEYRSYENLVRGALQRLGFTETERARLQVSMRYQVDAREVQVVEPVFVDPWYGPGFGRHRYPYGLYGPYADPFWFGPPVVQQVERRFVAYSRKLDITIVRVADYRNLYQVTVTSQGQNPTLAAVMPAMVQSAFADFPGPSGVPRVLEVKVEPAR